MRDIKIKRKVAAVNDWLFERNTQYKITVKTEKNGYIFNCYQGTRSIGGSMVEKETFDKDWETHLKKIAFGLLKLGFEYKIEARPVVTPMHDIRSEGDYAELIKRSRYIDAIRLGLESDNKPQEP